MARQRYTQSDLAAVLTVTPATAARRLSGAVPFDVYELAMVADWLGVDPDAFSPRIEQVSA